MRKRPTGVPHGKLGRQGPAQTEVHLEQLKPRCLSTRYLECRKLWPRGESLNTGWGHCWDASQSSARLRLRTQLRSSWGFGAHLEDRHVLTVRIRLGVMYGKDWHMHAWNGTCMDTGTKTVACEGTMTHQRFCRDLWQRAPHVVDAVGTAIGCQLWSQAVPPGNAGCSTNNDKRPGRDITRNHLYHKRASC